MKGVFYMTNCVKAIYVDEMIESRMNHMAIDAKYMEKRDFYYKTTGTLEAMSTAIIWLSDLNNTTIDYYKNEISRMRDDLDTWYYRVEI